MCFLPNCRYHIIKKRDNENLLQKTDQSGFTHQHLDFLYTFSKHRFSDKRFAKNGQVFGNVQSAFSFIKGTRRVHKLPTIAKTRPLRKKHQKYSLSFFQKTKSTQNFGSVLAERSKQGKETIKHLEQRNIAEYFQDGYANYTSKLVKIIMKALETSRFSNPKDICQC